MSRNGSAFSLIEAGVVTVVVALGGTVLTTAMSRTAEDARSAKCLDNLRRAMNAISAYTVDYGGVLPGPLHPAILRSVHNYGDLPGDYYSAGGTNRIKSLTWHLRPYFPPVGDSATNPSTPNPIVDAVFTCPTAQMVAPDGDFFAAGGALNRPYNYACNSWGPSTGPDGSYDEYWQQWFHTDPPWYFGIWTYSQFSPGDFQYTGVWHPKRLDAVSNASAEWAVGDAWYRRVAQPARRGSSSKRGFLGTFPAENSRSPLPSGPLHHVAFRQVRSHQRQGIAALPTVDFDGQTNLGYFDGHVSAFTGNWQELGDGGTVNPLWAYWGGDYTP
jgi:prepilin-type processing-associated H-X9-DG protein